MPSGTSPHWWHPTDIKDKRIRKSRLLQMPQAPRPILTPTKAWEIHHHPCMEDPEWPVPKFDLSLSFSDSKRLGIKANVPALPKNCKDSAKTLYDSSFAVNGPRLWNTIPDQSVKRHTGLEGFKNALNMGEASIVVGGKGFKLTILMCSLIRWSCNLVEVLFEVL